MRLAVEVAVWWAPLYVLWLAVISSYDLPELASGAAAALAGAATAALGRRAERVSYRPRTAWLRWLRVLPGGMASDMAQLTRLVGEQLVTRRPVRGGFRVVELPDDSDPGRARARRALATALLSSTPGGYVADLRPGAPYVLIVHDLTDSTDRARAALERP